MIHIYYVSVKKFHKRTHLIKMKLNNNFQKNKKPIKLFEKMSSIIECGALVENCFLLNVK